MDHAEAVAIDGFDKGGKPVRWDAREWPILCWSGFLFAMLFTMFGISAIVLRQRMKSELAGPILGIRMYRCFPC